MWRKNFLPLIGLTLITVTNFIPTVVTANDHHHVISQGEIKDSDIEFITILALMKGHLIVAKELLALNQPSKAEPHIGHPVEELYADIKPMLDQRKLPQFKTSLDKLHQLVQYKPNDPQVMTYYSDALGAIDTAMKGVNMQSPDFTMAVIKGLLNVAREEYAAAISNGKIVEEIEYQDSRGFVLYAEILSENLPNSPQIKTTITELKKAWPSVVPPSQAVKTPAEVAELISKI